VRQLALKAKVCGRWPNGVSLAVFPVDGDAVPEDKPFHLLNDFNYTMSDGKGGTVPDDDGLVCPIGSHTRRGNMRVQSLNGVKVKDHRILRRAGPYQDPYNEKDRDDPTTERGLVGFFLGASLAAQFEFIQSNWINYRNGFDVVTDPADPVMGTNTLPPGKAFYQTVPASADDSTPYVAPMNSFVFTKGSAYLYFPGLDGIRYIVGR
jgi:deferrochelatase/peroxidase EfeB